ncbi:hypothetical protein APICC_01247 [Apis cerana cerana]|uniref:Uncharacterized protein n=1 Tax=Apis cerana cerana TaxID=94128 RepID=A0A2A3ESX5_APICC|nr:hypothetical protein APICC_01247 [Apis cerana cerana]
MKKKIFEEGRGGKHEGGIGDGHWWWVVGGSGGGADGGSVGVGRARGGKWATEGCTRQVGRGGWTRSPWQPWLGFRAPADGLDNNHFGILWKYVFSLMERNSKVDKILRMIEDDTTLTTNDLSEINAVHSLLVVLCLLARCRQLVGHRYKVEFTLLFSNSSQTMFVGSVNTFASRETCSELVSECYLMFANSLHTRLKLRLNTYKDYSMALHLVVVPSFFSTKINMIKYERGNVFNCSLLHTSEQLVY